MSWKVFHILCWSPLPVAKIKLKINLDNKGVTILQIRKCHTFYLRPWLHIHALATFLCRKKYFTTFPEVSSCLTRQPLQQGPPKYSQPMLETGQWQFILLWGCLKSWPPPTLSLFRAKKLGTFSLILHFYHFTKPQPMFSNIYAFEQFLHFQKQLTQLSLKQV